MRAPAVFPFAALAVACIDHSPPIASQPTVAPIAVTAPSRAPAGQASLPPVSSSAGASPLPSAAPANAPIPPANAPAEALLSHDGKPLTPFVGRTAKEAALDAAAVPFATYLNGMHDRIHPIFAESFLESLDSLSANDPLNDHHLVTFLLIILTKDGHLKRSGVVRTSGIAAFDSAALDAIKRAQPFGPAPSAIVSPDGNVYVQWEFHRDPVYACGAQGARPYLLNVTP